MIPLNISGPVEFIFKIQERDILYMINKENKNMKWILLINKIEGKDLNYSNLPDDIDTIRNSRVNIIKMPLYNFKARAWSTHDKDQEAGTSREDSITITNIEYDSFYWYKLESKEELDKIKLDNVINLL